MDGWVGEGLAAGEDQEVEMGWLGGGDVSSVCRGRMEGSWGMGRRGWWVRGRRGLARWSFRAMRGGV